MIWHKLLSVNRYGKDQFTASKRGTSYVRNRFITFINKMFDTRAVFIGERRESDNQARAPNPVDYRI